MHVSSLQLLQEWLEEATSAECITIPPIPSPLWQLASAMETKPD